MGRCVVSVREDELTDPSGGWDTADHLLLGEAHAEEQRQPVPKRDQLPIALNDFIGAPGRIISVIQKRSPNRRLELLLLFEKLSPRFARLGPIAARMLLTKKSEMHGY